VKVLTDRQVDRILHLILFIERSSSKEDSTRYVEEIREIIRQAEQVTLKME